jgi:hypothetical protein
MGSGFPPSVIIQCGYRTSRALGYVVKLLVTIATFWLVLQVIYRPWWQLLDYRVVSAPSAVVAFAEEPCQLEMYRHAREKWIRLVRFTADCPLCGGSVELMPSKHDYRVPLVSRCLESPITMCSASTAATYSAPTWAHHCLRP